MYLYICTAIPHLSGTFWAFAKSCIFCPFLRTTVCLWHECRTRFKGRGRFFLKKSALQMMINTSFCAIFLNFCHLLFTYIGRFWTAMTKKFATFLWGKIKILDSYFQKQRQVLAFLPSDFIFRFWNSIRALYLTVLHFAQRMHFTFAYIDLNVNKFWFISFSCQRNIDFLHVREDDTFIHIILHDLSFWDLESTLW